MRVIVERENFFFDVTSFISSYHTNYVQTIGFTTAIRSVTASGSTLGPLGGFVLTGPVIVQGLFLSLFIGMLAGIVPSFGAARKPVATALHEIF